MRYTLHKDLRYGEHERQVLDISVPDGRAQGLILFIHGGIWMYGDKSAQPLFLDTFRDRFLVASMNHRYIDDTVHMKDLLDDIHGALTGIQRFCFEQGIDPKKTVIMGHSSGAHLSMLYAYQYAEASPLPLAFCVSLAGPTDLRDVAFLYSFKKLGWLKLFYDVGKKATGHTVADGDITDLGYGETAQQLLAAISPLSYVGETTIPTILVHDVADTIVPYSNSAALHHVFDAYGVEHQFIALYSGIGHILGAKKGNKSGALRYDAALEGRLVAAMDAYLAKYSD
jgi:acetyl esterase/lipase